MWNMFASILFDLPTCHLNSCNLGSTAIFLNLVLSKQSQEFPKSLTRLVIDYILPKLLVTYDMQSLD